MTFAIVWFFVALSAESSFFPLAEPVNEHRPYLAMLGLGALASVALWHAAAFAARRSGAPAVWVFAVIVTAAASLLGAVTFVRNRTWQDELTIWLDATEKAPANARAWLNAGHAAVGRGDLDRARSLLNEGYRLSPCYAYILLNLSALETRVGDRAAALRWAEEAVDCNPGFALTHYYRALAVENLNRFDEALADYRRTTAIDDQHADAWLRQARLLEWQKSPAEAARAYERAFAADPTRAQAAAWARQEARP
jgi:tetratricopeptide (TPR) repeat protein